jgi:hypothetical protein
LRLLILKFGDYIREQIGQWVATLLHTQNIIGKPGTLQAFLNDPPFLRDVQLLIAFGNIRAFFGCDLGFIPAALPVQINLANTVNALSITVRGAFSRQIHKNTGIIY